MLKIGNVSVDVEYTWETDYGDVRGYATLEKDGTQIGNIITSYEKSMIENCVCLGNRTNIFEVLIFRDFDEYLCLPRISKCSKLLQTVYDNVCESEVSMCHIDEDDWNDLYADDFDDKDIEILENEITKYGLEDIITINQDEYKIVGYGNLETEFIDDRE